VKLGKENREQVTPIRRKNTDMGNRRGGFRKWSIHGLERRLFAK
jgi:hypothetical protein